ncbi:hypothetical protein D3C71_1675130 [compost metagenome]
MQEQVGHGIALRAEDDGAFAVPVAAHGGVIGGVVKEAGGLVAQYISHLPGGGFQRLGRLTRDQHRNRRGLGHFAFGGRVARRRAFQDDVGVRPAKAKRVHAHHQLARLAQLAVLGDDVQIPFPEFDLGVKRFDADGGRHDAVAQYI